MNPSVGVIRLDLLSVLTLAGLSILLAACGPIQSAKVQEQINAMNGLSKEQVLSCMGPPTSKSSEGATEVWSYSTLGSTTTDAVVTGNQYGAYGSTTTSQEYCLVNLMIQNGVVIASNYRSQGKALAPSLPCYSVLYACTQRSLGTSNAAAPGQSVADKTKEALAFCKEPYKDPRLDTIRAVIPPDLPPTLTQQSDANFITDEQRPALSAYKELNEQCLTRIAAANPQLWKIMMQVSPAPYENLKALYDKQITIGQYNTRRQALLDKLQAAIANQIK